MKVVLDTNFLFVPFIFGIDVFEEINRVLPGAEVCVAAGTLKELERIAEKGTKEKKMVALIKRILDRKKVWVVEREGPVDKTLLELAKEGYVVATNDAELRKKVWKEGGKVIYVRGKKKLELQ